MEISELTKTLIALGCPAAKAPEMAAQLDKRAHQHALEKNQSYEQSLQYLLGLMRQGWAAQQNK